MKAKEFAATIELDSNFLASHGWLQRFKTRTGLKSYRLHGEAASTPVEHVEIAQTKIQEILASYWLEDIFNTDEIRLL